MECLHHTRELPAKNIQRLVSGRRTTGPGEVTFIKYHNLFNEVREDLMADTFVPKEFDWDRYQ